MLQHEKFLRKTFPNILDHQNEVSASSPIEKAKKKAVFYLESRCSSKYGFMGEAHTDGDMSKSDSVYTIPTSYDTSLLLPYIMNEGIDPIIIENLVSVLKRSRRSCGLWNYFFDPEHKSSSLVPDDIDDTALPATALYHTGNFTIAECREVGRNLLDHSLIDPDTGVITTWNPDDTRKIIFDRYQDVPKLCAGCLINFLWFMSISGMDTVPELIPSIEYVDSFIDELIANKGKAKMEHPGMCYYPNKYTYYLFISRFIQRSKYAQEKFGQKFVDHLIEEFRLFAEKEDTEALDMCLMVLGIWHLNLHKFGEQSWLTDEKEIVGIRENIKKFCERLLDLQDEDGSYRAWIIFRWNKIGHWGGNRNTTTAFALAVFGIAEREIYGENELEQETKGIRKLSK